MMTTGNNKLTRFPFSLVCMALLVAPAAAQTTMQAGGQTYTPQAHTGTQYAAPHNPNGTPGVVQQNLVSQLRNILAMEAQQGRFPNNTPMLQSIQALVSQYSGGNSGVVTTPYAHTGPQFGTGSTTTPYAHTGTQFGTGSPAIQSPLVEVTNKGPGYLQIQKPGLPALVLAPNVSKQVNVNNSVSFIANQQNTEIAIRHVANGLAKFWDADDQKDFFIRPNQTTTYNLGMGVTGYTLKKK